MRVRLWRGEHSERCLAACEVLPGTLKRCQLDAGHGGVHRWLEAVAERQAEAQWAWEHTACEHDDIVQTPRRRDMVRRLRASARRHHTAMIRCFPTGRARAA